MSRWLSLSFWTCPRIVQLWIISIFWRDGRYSWLPAQWFSLSNVSIDGYGRWLRIVPVVQFVSRVPISKRTHSDPDTVGPYPFNYFERALKSML